MDAEEDGQGQQESAGQSPVSVHVGGCGAHSEFRALLQVITCVKVRSLERCPCLHGARRAGRGQRRQDDEEWGMFNLTSHEQPLRNS